MMPSKDIRHITLLPEISNALNHTIRQYTGPHCIRERAEIITLNSQGLHNIQISLMLGCHENTVSKWICRFRNVLPDLNELVKANKECDNERNYCKIEDILSNILSDNPRPCCPEVFGLDVRFFITWICCQDPTDYGFENNMWHLPQIQMAVKLSEIGLVEK